MSPFPPFVRLPESSISGRLISAGFGGQTGPPIPAILEAHKLPGMIGSSVYVLGAVGPSTSSWPFFPGGGVVITSWNEMRRLSVADEIDYAFEIDDKSIPLDDDFLDFGQPHGPDDLISLVMRIAAESLGLHPWDESAVSEAIESCKGWDHFDEFMALPEAEFPSPR